MQDSPQPSPDARLAEVAGRLSAIVLIARRGEELGVTPAESLTAIDGLAGWAGVHLAAMEAA